MLRDSSLICSIAPALGGLMIAKRYDCSSAFVKGVVNKSRFCSVIFPSAASSSAFSAVTSESKPSTLKRSLSGRAKVPRPQNRSTTEPSSWGKYSSTNLVNI